MKLVRALREYNLEQIVAILQPHLGLPHADLRNRLRPIFEQASLDQLDLLQPPGDFHHWLQPALLVNYKGSTPAKPNTILARLSTLSSMYAYLIQLGLLRENPLQGMTRPAAHLQEAALPTSEQLRVLIRQTGDLHTRIAQQLMYRLAFQVKELHALAWEHLDLPREEVLRAAGSAPLSASALHDDGELLRDLHELAAKNGGPLHAQGFVLPYRRADELNSALWRAWQKALPDHPYPGPRLMRKAALRDHSPQLTPYQLGFLNVKSYALALQVARAAKA